MWDSHSGEYYPAIKRNEVLTHTTWMSLEHIRLSEKPATEEYILYDFIYMKYSEVPMHRDSRLGVARGWGRGSEE